MAKTRFDYIQYDEKSSVTQALFKETFISVATAVEVLTPGRATSLALTKLEEAYMWVGKAVRDDQIARVGGSPILNETRS